jgi:hypothetical protein
MAGAPHVGLELLAVESQPDRVPGKFLDFELPLGALNGRNVAQGTNARASRLVRPVSRRKGPSQSGVG